MGKYETKRAGKSFKGAVMTVVMIIGLAVLVLFAMPQLLHDHSNESSGPSNDADASTSDAQIATSDKDTASTEEKNAVTDETSKSLAFPLRLEDGKLEIESIFQFDGINPDCGKQKGDHIAAITLINTSDAYLSSATINAAFDDGSVHTFAVYDLPAGKAVMAFSLDNSELPAANACVDVHIESVFEDVQNVDSVLATIDGMTVTLENVTDRELFGIDVYCRDVFSDKYFGGVTYMYKIEKIPAGGSTTITASDCILGMVDVVRIVVNDQK